MTSYKAVIGLGFGDEGKGLVTDYLCSVSENPIVVRFSGGQQAGHTVWFEDRKHTFSNFGSGTFRGAATVWMNSCTIDPIGISREFKILKDLNTTPILYIHPECPVTTPYEIEKNQQDINYIHNGTCGVGVGCTWQREENNYHLRAKDLYNLSVLKIKLDLLAEYYGYTTPEIQRFYAAVQSITKNPYIYIQQYTFGIHDDVIFEGSQGLLLDQEIGFFPHVTRSYTGSKMIWNYDPEYYLVTRAYQTRHGEGPMTNRDMDLNLTNNEHENNQENKWQGCLRTSPLDMNLIKYAIQSDEYILNSSYLNLIITCLDQLKPPYHYTLDQKEVKFNGPLSMSDGIRFIFNRSIRGSLVNTYCSYSKYSDDLKKADEIDV